MSGALQDEDVDANAQDGPYYLAPGSVDTSDHGTDLNVVETLEPKLGRTQYSNKIAIAKKQVPSRDKSNIDPRLLGGELEGNVSKRSTSEACRTTGADTREDDNDHFGYDPRDFSHDFQGRDFPQSFLDNFDKKGLENPAEDHASNSPRSVSPVDWESPGHDVSQSLQEVPAILSEEPPKVSTQQEITIYIGIWDQLTNCVYSMVKNRQLLVQTESTATSPPQAAGSQRKPATWQGKGSIDHKTTRQGNTPQRETPARTKTE